MRLHNDPEWVLPFSSMEPGDSFFIPTVKAPDLLYAIESGAKRAKVRVKALVVVEGDLMGVRTWMLS
tara:strand:- start:196 stop:396 length:201 start_codon:yes stop_codon:yes gene_type:complete